MLAQGASPDAQNQKGTTALHLAALNDDAPTLKLLCAKKPRLDLTAEDGNTALHCAAMNDARKAAEVLLENAAGSNLSNKAKLTPLHIAVAKSHVAMVTLLVKSGADINLEGASGGMTPLQLMVVGNRSQMVELLLELGADVNWRSSDGLSSLHLASAAGRLDMVKLLVSSGANVNLRTRNGGVPVLQFAAGKGHTAILEFLLESGAELAAKDLRGLTAEQFAADQQQPEAEALLRERRLLKAYGPPIHPSTHRAPAIMNTDADTIADSIREHLKKVRQGDTEMAQFIDHFLNDRVIQEIGFEAARKMKQSLQDSEVHSVVIVKPPICYFTWTCPFNLSAAGDWFQKKYGGYTIALQQCFKADFFTKNACEAHIDVVCALDSLNMSMIPVRSPRFTFQPSIAFELLMDEERRALGG